MARVWAARVLETTTTTGTGAIALAAAVTGFKRFSAACAVGDRVSYSIWAADVNGNPSGDWECGLGTYSATNTLTRTTVEESSNANAAVNFAAGTKYVMLSPAPADFRPSQPSTETGTSYTFDADDARAYVRFSNASAITATVPPNSSVPYALGTEIFVEQAGAGALSIAAGSGVTINSRAADLTLAGQYAVAFLKKVATDTWILNGDL